MVDLDDDKTVSENNGLPSVNKKRGRSNLLTLLGYGFIILAGAGAIFWVNYHPKEKEVVVAPKPVVNKKMPPLVIPKPVEQKPVQQPIVKPLAPPPPVTLPAPESSRSRGTTTGGTKKEKTWFERKMGGKLVLDGSAQVPNALMDGKTASKVPSYPAADLNPLERSLIPTKAAGSVAAFLPDRNYLITKGTSLDCALETAIDSTVPGITTCRLTRDVYSANGQVKLLDKGSKLVGEYQGGIKQGQARIFVLWTRSETPEGVIITLDSPGTDPLGRSGLEGWVDNHFMDRFGAAIMMSFIQGTVEAIANSTQDSSSATVYQSTASGGGDIVKEIITQTVNIPPTLIKNQGEHIRIMLARDLDFSSVYGLKIIE